MTPHEFNEASRGYAEVARDQIELAKAQAYWSAMLGRAKDPPTFERWMRGESKPRALTGEEAERRKREHEEIVAEFEKVQADRAAEAEKAEAGGKE